MAVNVEVLLGKSDDLDSALRTLKKRALKDGLFKEMKKREHYEKPSEKRRRKQAEARAKVRKKLKKFQAWDDDTKVIRSAHRSTFITPKGQPS